MLLSSSLLTLLTGGGVAVALLDTALFLPSLLFGSPSGNTDILHFALGVLTIFALWLLSEKVGIPGWGILILIFSPIIDELQFSPPFTLLTDGSVAAILIDAALIVLLIVVLWRIFKKAGMPGWLALIPILNIAAYIRVAKFPPLMFLFYFGVLIPPHGAIAVLILNIIVTACIGHAFNKSSGFIAGMILLPFIFLPILAFGDSEYNFEGRYW